MTIEKNDKVKSRCSFDIDDQHRCQNNANPGFKYCLEHLELLTRIHTKTAIYHCLSEQLGIDIAVIEDSFTISKQLGADSLDLVELVMALEELFDMEVPDKDSEKLITVRDVFTYAYSRLLYVKKYVTHPFSDILNAYQKVKNKESCIKREIITIVNSDLFLDYTRQLGINTNQLATLIVDTIGNNWIEHVTTVPQFKNKSFSGAHIILLSKKNLFYFFLEYKSIEVRKFHLNDFSLKSISKYNRNNEVESIKIFFFYQMNGDELEIELDFENHIGVSGANIFLKKYYKFEEEL